MQNPETPFLLEACNVFGKIPSSYKFFPLFNSFSKETTKVLDKVHLKLPISSRISITNSQNIKLLRLKIEAKFAAVKGFCCFICSFIQFSLMSSVGIYFETWVS